MTTGTCRSCNYYLTGSDVLHCLMAPDNPPVEREKIRNGLIGKCNDFKPILLRDPKLER